MPTALDSLREMPTELESQLGTLEQWALRNRQDARRDVITFWALKIPAILAASSSGIFSYFQWQAAPIVAGALASLCVLIDGLHPMGQLRNTHMKAFYDLRTLEQNMKARWQVGRLRGEVGRTLAANIIESAMAEKDKISKYLKDAEASLDAKHS